jgi:hypothetical protein
MAGIALITLVNDTSENERALTATADLMALNRLNCTTTSRRTLVSKTDYGWNPASGKTTIGRVR